MFEAAAGRFLRASKGVFWSWLVTSVSKEGECLLRILGLLLGKRRDQDNSASDIPERSL